MEIFRHIPPQDGIAPPCAITIGNFDGVHLGHQALLHQLREEASKRGLSTAALIFEPHPIEYFHKKALSADPACKSTTPSGLRRIFMLRDKLAALLESKKLDRVYTVRFDANFAAQQPVAFLERLAGPLHARFVLIGDDFRFGEKRAGDFSLLTEFAKKTGAFEVASLPTQQHSLSPNASFTATARVSSSAIRCALIQGNIGLASALAGRPIRFSGRVRRGRQLGRQLGFPTMNLRVPVPLALEGIFVVKTQLSQQSGAKELPGVASLGTRPSIESSAERWLEVHLFDFDEDFYGRRICVEFLHKLRDEARFHSLGDLKHHIRMDAIAARKWFADRM